MKGKKNKFIFTIGFKRTDPEHVRVADILNETDSKNQFIVDAVLCYVDSGYMNVRPWNIQPAFGQPAVIPAVDSSADKHELEQEITDELEEDASGILQSLQGFRRDCG